MELVVDDLELEDKLFWLEGEQVRVTFKNLLSWEPNHTSDGLLFHVSDECILIETATDTFQRIFKRYILSIEKLA